MTEPRAARIGVACALVLILAQLLVASAWSLSHNDPTELDLTRRCLEREKSLAVEPANDPVAASASGGALATVVEGNAVTVSVARSEAEGRRQAAERAGEREPERRRVPDPRLGQGRQPVLARDDVGVPLVRERVVAAQPVVVPGVPDEQRRLRDQDRRRGAPVATRSRLSRRSRRSPAAG
jgi:hypothetical protein